MRNFAFAALAITFLFSSCKEGSFQKGEQGMEYKIIKSGKGETIKNGEFMFFHIKQSYNNGTKDSVFVMFLLYSSFLLQTLPQEL